MLSWIKKWSGFQTLVSSTDKIEKAEVSGSIVFGTAEMISKWSEYYFDRAVQIPDDPTQNNLHQN